MFTVTYHFCCNLVDDDLGGNFGSYTGGFRGTGQVASEESTGLAATREFQSTTTEKIIKISF